MALYQNGILISGANKLPQMTYAEWQALPAAERPSEWICTDRSYSDLPASDVTYDNTESGLSADNIQDAIDEVAQSGGGGGHTIVNPSGQSMDQEQNLQFTDAGVEDDDTNNKTKISIVREMTKAEYDALSEVERKGVIRITDEPDIVMGDVGDDKVEIEQVTGGTKTYGELLNELRTKIDASKLTDNAVLKEINGNDRNIYNFCYQYGTSSAIQFSRASHNNGGATTVVMDFISGSYYVCVGTNRENRASNTAPEGYKLTLYYGTQSAPIELTTDAEHCLMSDGESVESALTWKEIGDISLNQSVSIDLSEYSEICFIPIINSTVAFNSSTMPTSVISGVSSHRVELAIFESTSYNARFVLEYSNNTLTLITVSFAGWTSATISIFAR